MLIRHISIPRNSHLTALHEPPQKTQVQESTDYSNHLNRTLNPQRPASDILVDHFSPKKSHPKQETKPPLFQTFSKPQFLVKEYPLTIEEFTNAPLSPQQTQQPVKQQSEASPRVRGQYRIKDNWSTLSPHLNNNAYMKSARKAEGSLPAFEKVKNNMYLKQERQESPSQLLLPKKDCECDGDQGLVNLHSKMKAKKSELYYKTLNRFRERNMLKEGNESMIQQKKYNLSLPKSTLQPREWSSSLNKEDTPLQMRKTKKENGFRQMTNKQNSVYLPHQTKRNALPAQEEEEDREHLTFDNPTKGKLPRRASEQQSTIIAKPQYETLRTNKMLKKRNSALDFQPKEKSHSELNEPEVQQNTPTNKTKFRNNQYVPPPPVSTDVEISYRVSLSQLKQICASSDFSWQKLVIKIPEIFSYPLFTGNEQQEQLFQKASEMVKHLQIRCNGDISLKKYTNCILVVAGNLAVIWHFSGKVYFGGWKYHLLDEGTKTGLGLEWAPEKYVYYGEFVKNKREGVGIMKSTGNEVMAGVWRQNRFLKPMSVQVRLQAEDRGQPC